MLLQTDTGANTGVPDALWFILGASLVIIIFAVWKFFEQLEKERRKPNVILIDISTWTPRYLGTYEGIIRPRVEITNGHVKEFFAIQTRTPYGPRFIIPSHGKPEDVLMENDRLPSMKFVLAILLGTGGQGPQVHQQWANDAFSSSSVRFTNPNVLPDNYFLVRPYWSRGMLRSAFVRSTMNMASVFSFVDKYISDYDLEIEKIWEQVSTLMSNRLQFMNDLLITQWAIISDAWNTIHKERVTPLSVLANLLHISPSKVGYAGLGQALAQGGLDAASKFITALKGSVAKIVDNMDMVAMDKTSAQLLFKKLGQQREQLINATQQNQAFKEAQNQMIAQMSSEPESAAPNPADRPIAMQKSERAAVSHSR